MEFKIKDIITHKISGEWGEEAAFGEGVQVIRTANFTNLGTIDFGKIVYRNIDEKKVEQKKLIKGDIIIEKSGGSPTQPVGRVVFFDIDTDESYLCNNFTTILRPNTEIIYPKYFFYQLFIGHIRGKTLKYQNKTTGIINLKLDNYLNEKINVPPHEEQIQIANILSKTENLITQRKKSIDLLDDFLKSTFLKMFGDPVKNEKGWEKTKLGGSIFNIIAGSSMINNQGERKWEGLEVKILKISAVTSGVFNPNEYKIIDSSQLGNKILTVQEGDLLFSRANTRELVGATCIVKENYNHDLHLPDKIWVLQLFDDLDKHYLHFLLQNVTFKNNLTKTATGSSGSMLNISMEKLRALLIPLPPISLQKEFANIVEKSDALKKQYTTSLLELENLFAALSQKAFKGELVVNSTDSFTEVEETALVEQPVKAVLLDEDIVTFDEQGEEIIWYVEKDAFLSIIDEKHGGTIKNIILKTTFTPESKIDIVYRRTFPKVVSNIDSQLKMSKFQYWLMSLFIKKLKTAPAGNTQVIDTAAQQGLAEIAQICEENNDSFNNYLSIHSPFLEQYLRDNEIEITQDIIIMMEATLQLSFVIVYKLILSKQFETILINATYYTLFSGQLKEGMREQPLLADGRDITDDSTSDDELEQILPWNEVSYEQIANWIKKRYRENNFSVEMLIRYLTSNHISELDYYSSEELKKKPRLNETEDLKAFIFSAVAGENPFIKFEQLFYNGETENIILNLREEDYELIKDRSAKERSGIYFRLISL